MTTRRCALGLLALVVVSVAGTWPLAAVWRPALPDHHDALFSSWRLAWVAHQLPADPARLFDANIFWPARNTLAFSDAMLLPGLLGAPLIAAGVHPVVVHNLLLLAAFVFAGAGAARLFHRLLPDMHGAVIAAAIFAFAPYRFAHLGHLELLWTGFIPLAIVALDDAIAAPGVRRGAWLGVIVGLQGLCSLYYLMFLLIWLVPLALLRLNTRPTRRHLIALAAAAVTLAVLISPYIGPYVAARADLGTRPDEEVERYSAIWRDYLRVHPTNWLYGAWSAESLDERSLFPGLTALALAAVAVVLARGPLVRTYAIATAIAVDLSLGTHGLLFEPLRALLPPLASIRAPARFGVLSLLGIATLAGVGLAYVTAHLSRARRLAVVAVVLGALTAEYWSGPVRTQTVPLSPLRVHDWLTAQPPLVVLELPVPTPETLWEREPLFAYLSIYHWRPLANGYSGFAPRSYIELLEELRSFPADASVEVLIRRGVQVVFAHERFMTNDRFNAILRACGDTRWFAPPVVFDVSAGQGRTAACRVLPDAARRAGAPLPSPGPADRP